MGTLNSKIQRLFMQNSSKRDRPFQVLLQAFLSLGIIGLTVGLIKLPTAQAPSVPDQGHQDSALAKTPKPAPVRLSRPIKTSKRQVAGVSLYQTTIDLTDRHTFLAVGLANQADQANSARISSGDEPFEAMVDRQNAAIAISGTFFSLDDQKRVMGNMVSGGTFLKYSPWENYGTTLGLGKHNRPEMVTARVQGQPRWDQHWFSITAGPRLLKQGQVWIAPRSEGFSDPRVMGVAARAAVGFSRNGKQLIFVTFLSELSLQKEAQIMKAIGCYDAMNLDGGTSLGLARSNQVLVSPGRDLTNVIVAYDTKHPAPSHLKQSWSRFQKIGRAYLQLTH